MKHTEENEYHTVSNTGHRESHIAIYSQHHVSSHISQRSPDTHRYFSSEIQKEIRFSDSFSSSVLHLYIFFFHASFSFIHALHKRREESSFSPLLSEEERASEYREAEVRAAASERAVIDSFLFFLFADVPASLLPYFPLLLHASATLYTAEPLQDFL